MEAFILEDWFGTSRGKGSSVHPPDDKALQAEGCSDNYRFRASANLLPISTKNIRNNKTSLYEWKMMLYMSEDSGNN